MNTKSREEKKKKRIYLTKNRLKALHVALTFDDILYEKHRRLIEGLRKEKRGLERKGNVLRVYGRDKNGDLFAKMILDVHVTTEGQVVYIEETF